MTRYFLPLSAALALVLAAPGMAQQTLNVRDADIRAFIQDAARVTGRTFIIDNRVQGKVSVVTDRPLSRSEYFEIVLSTLRANGLVAVPAPGGAYRIQPADGAAGQPSGVGRAANRNSFVTEVFRLRSIDAASALETLRPLVSKDGSVTANRAGNSVVVADYADNIARIRQVIARVDRDISSTQMVMLKNAGAREIATSLQALVESGGGENAAPSAATVVPIDSSNAIAIRGDANTVARLAAMARQLDQQAASGTEIRVYWLEHADAEKLLPVLQQLVGQSTSQPVTASTPAAGGAAPASAAAAPVVAASSSSSGSGISTRGPAIVTRYEGANAIIVAANSDVQRMLGETIRQIDTRREQVLVEAIIVEISDAAAKKLGVQFLIGSTSTGFAATNYSNASPNLLTLAGAYGATQLGTTKTTVVAPDGTQTTTEVQNSGDLASTLQQSAFNSLTSATGAIAGLGGSIGKNGIFGAIINAVKSDTESNLLSTPSVMTLDNQKASILVGQQVPVTTGEALSQNFDNQFRTVQRQDVGIKLEVKPQINTGGAIKLFLRQEVSSVAGPVSNSSSDLIINKREIETTVTVDDGEILALGGLLDDNERKTIERIPLLSDIPGLGELFKSRSRSRTKTNLMVFIRPTILRSKEDAQKLTQQRYGYVRNMQLQRNPDMEPTIDELVRDYMGATPPVAPQPGDAMVQPDAPQMIEPTVRQSSGVVRPVEIPASGERK
ncbi:MULTISPECIES: type II secretion system secretin GspD [unclassified Sphingobium]|uniref:type II secretion system secretin GspD n=1 Tax=unclassified Sphingobium TaxID=2611147 RepID=UPI000D15B1BE|nr:MULTISPECIES: type II secretion system secretin GspD [unclassified Sphingobium]MBG6116979.1 general secretion pathway protein D [Sphingobium sp. JAI105]PSO11455.1 type II secretion system protein GspD [Sphingobium sp. AEW4]TWD12813.1 general secretion pathway protein D [Sphingobium sp. AEW010]TWD30584.1 general secretion pathway protein D [Sphingobium sp. AEW013]TWD30661.1 general secretion pathway protein D [Sphingobium sp. AEW001]